IRGRQRPIWLLVRRFVPVAAAASCSFIERETGREGERKKGEGAGGAGSGRLSLAVAAPATGRRASQARLRSTLA
uniref:Uncharacterized protein n=1 Tax=Triticum urartu TaxID=4572 RepID=A0A8R7PRB0_TRIUA